LTTPSLLTLQSSASLTGLKAIFSIPAKWPLSSVENRTLGFSGFPAARLGQLGRPGDCLLGCEDATHKHGVSCRKSLLQQEYLEDSKQWSAD
jgi:hypothetical protein